MDEQAIKSFKEKLDDQHQWPGIYVFKFIVPVNKVPAVKALFPNEEVIAKASSKGNYTSLTIRSQMKSSDQVVILYIEAKKIEGIISL